MKKILLIVYFLFIIFYPKYTYCDSCYQDMLFTTEGKIDRNNDKFGGICFKIGGNIEDIKVWERYKFGYPFSAITTDYQRESNIFQCRIQYDYIFLNIFFVSIIAFPIYFILKIIYNFFKKILVDSRIFKK